MAANVDELLQRHSINELNEMLAHYEAEEAAAIAEIKRYSQSISSLAQRMPESWKHSLRQRD